MKTLSRLTQARLTQTLTRFGLMAGMLLGLMAARLCPQSGEDRERGDVPGWVMITMMSALIVAALIAIAIPALTQMFQSALEKVQ